MRDAVQEVGRAVQRVHHPAPGPVVAAGSAGFLHQEGVAGAGAAQLLAQGAFGAQVGLADEVGRALDADLQLLDLGEVAQQALGRLLRGVLHDGHVGREALGHVAKTFSRRIGRGRRCAGRRRPHCLANDHCGESRIRPYDLEKSATWSRQRGLSGASTRGRPSWRWPFPGRSVLTARVLRIPAAGTTPWSGACPPARLGKE